MHGIFKVLIALAVCAYCVLMAFENANLQSENMALQARLNVVTLAFLKCDQFVKRHELRRESTDKQIFMKEVTVTMYHPVSGQTDDRPNETADGTIIQVRNASKYKFIAVSRDLHVRWGGQLHFGDFVYLDAGDNDKTGVYQVRDIMNRRFTNRIDILESPGVKPYKINRAVLARLEIPNTEFSE